MKALEDSELVLRLQNNEVSAFDILYWKYHAAIYANVLKLIKEEPITEDIVQEVFIALWEKRSSLDANQPVAGWLFVVSYNRAINQLKKILQQQKAQKNLIAPADFTEDDFRFSEEQSSLVKKAVDQLSPQKRKVFELCKMQGKTYEQTAAELNISKHTVKEYLSDAIAFIKNYVHKHPEQFVLMPALLTISF